MSRYLPFICWALWGVVAPVRELPAEDIETLMVMYHDPELLRPGLILQLNENLLPLWMQALARPEADYQRLAAEAIAFAAEEGYSEMKTAEEELLAVLSAEGTHPSARFAASRALIAIDARSAADELFAAATNGGIEMRLLVEPALAKWGYEPIAPIWRDRIGDPSTNRRDLELALDGLRQLQDDGALAEMLQIVHSPNRPPDQRLVAARAAGEAATSGLETAVERLLTRDDPQVLHRLCAVALLSRHSSEEARRLLAQLARDPDPTVTEQALGFLFAIDPQLVLPLAVEAMQNADPKVRRRGADAFVTLPTADRVAVLSQLLDDPHPDLRRGIRRELIQLSERPELNDAVRGSAMDILALESWRGQEQAALLLGELDHEPSASRLVELLSSSRPEVMIATAWSLRELAVTESLPDMLMHAERQTTVRRTSQAPDGLDEQVALLFEAMGLQDYEPSEELLRSYVPKNKINGEYSRGAAIWALGYLHVGEPDEELALQLVERLNDTMDFYNPESELVFRMSAITLGRMQVESQVPALRARMVSVLSHDLVSCAIRWAIHEITGEEFPELNPEIKGRTGWFLEPLSSEAPSAP